MKKIVFFTHKPISHLYPLEELFAYLQQCGFKLICFGYIERKEYFEDKNIEFIEYLKDNDITVSSEIEYFSNEYIELSLKGKYKEALNVYLKMCALQMHFISEVVISKYVNMVKQISPEYIFHDIVDLYAPIICEKLGIKQVDYITNIYYSKDFFETNPYELYSILTRNIHIDNDEFKKYLEKYWDISTSIYEIVEEKYNLYPVPPLSQFRMMGDLNLIFSTKVLQPKQIGNNSILFEPNISHFVIENDIPMKLLEFVNKHKNIIYVSSGSFISEDKDYYIQLFERLKNIKLSFVISCGKSINILKEVIEEKNIQYDIYYEKFLPQKFVLSHSSVFLTTGGFNSIIESIYYKVPMIINPISAEQRMNGFIIESLGLGKCLYSKNLPYDLSQIFNVTMNDKKIRNNLKKYNHVLINNSNDDNYMFLKRYLNNE